MPISKTGENDLHKLQVNDSEYMKVRTIYLFSKRENWCQGDSFQAWAYKRAPLNSQSLVLRIGGTDFLHCWVADSMHVYG